MEAAITNVKSEVTACGWPGYEERGVFAQTGRQTIEPATILTLFDAVAAALLSRLA
jgi:hypothetical protein